MSMETPSSDTEQLDYRSLATQSVVAAIVGLLSGLALLLFEGAAHRIEHLLWHRLPDALEIGHGAGWWTVLVMAVGGLAVGIVLHVAPGHGGHDPATEALFGAPISIVAVPGLLIAALITLSIGVSMGPEAPLLGASGAALAAVAMRRNVPAQGLISLGVAGMLGAMFGAPIGAAFAFMELVPATGRGLYAKLFPLLVAASAGALTVTLIATRPRLFVALPPARDFLVIDIASALVIGAVAAALGVCFGYALRAIHPLTHRVPVIARLAVAGAALAGIAVVAGDVVLFSGQREMSDFLMEYPDFSNGRVLLITIAKLMSLVLAVAVGFRGGRIFPAVFVGLALGALIHGLIPGIPLTLAVGAAMVGILIAFVRAWFLSILMVTLIVGADVLPLLGVALLGAYLIVANAPELRVNDHVENTPNNSY
jgi:H+/Cl- antiporter ClcA